jgi:hypothetical protein
MMLKVDRYVRIHEQSMTRHLFSGHITSGVKLAGLHHRHLYGTREVAVVLRVAIHQLCRIHKTAAADQIVVAGKLLKGRGAKDLACSGLMISYNHKMG